MKRVALFDPYLDTMGGGEKHILSMIEVLAEKGYEVTIFWDRNMNQDLKERFTLKYAGKYRYLPNIFKKPDPVNTFKVLSRFDCFFYVTDGSYFASGAGKNFVFAMVPDKKLYALNIVNRLKLWNYKFISNSPYTTDHLISWGIKPETITPYIAQDVLEAKSEKKEKIILSVARFFPHLHSKNQSQILTAFKRLKGSSPLFKDYKLVLVGGLKDEDREYFNGLKKLASKDRAITFKPNVSNAELLSFYGKASYFWHFTGFGVDGKTNPEMVEHFGIAPLEAMATGGITFCFNAGGPREFIKDGETGFLFSEIDEIVEKMIDVEKNVALKDRVRKSASQLVKNRYNYQVFKEKVLGLL